MTHLSAAAASTSAEKVKSRKIKTEMLLSAFCKWQWCWWCALKATNDETDVWRHQTTRIRNGQAGRRTGHVLKIIKTTNWKLLCIVFLNFAKFSSPFQRRRCVSVYVSDADTFCIYTEGERLLMCWLFIYAFRSRINNSFSFRFNSAVSCWTVEVFDEVQRRETCIRQLCPQEMAHKTINAIEQFILRLTRIQVSMCALFISISFLSVHFAQAHHCWIEYDCHNNYY